MKGTIIGFEPVDYKKKDSDERQKGIRLIITCRSNDVIGLTAKEEFIKADSPFYRQDILPYLANDIDSLINASIYIDYNILRRGNFTFTDIADLEITPAAKPNQKGE